PGANVIVRIRTSVGPFVWNLIRSLFRWTVSLKSAFATRIVETFPEPGDPKATATNVPTTATPTAAVSSRPCFLFILGMSLLAFLSLASLVLRGGDGLGVAASCACDAVPLSLVLLSERDRFVQWPGSHNQLRDRQFGVARLRRPSSAVVEDCRARSLCGVVVLGEQVERQAELLEQAPLAASAAERVPHGVGQRVRAVAAVSVAAVGGAGQPRPNLVG